MTHIEHFDVYLVTSNGCYHGVILCGSFFNAPSIDHAPAKYKEKHKKLFSELQIGEKLIIFEILKIPDELIGFIFDFRIPHAKQSLKVDIRRKSTLRI